MHTLHLRLMAVCYFAVVLSTVGTIPTVQPLLAQDGAGKKQTTQAGASADVAVETVGGGRLIDVQRIWDASKHNAFTDLIRFNDEWFCVFREATQHVSGDGALRVIRSSDAITWTSAALITSDVADLRDAKITVTPDRQLMLSGAAAMHDTSQYKHQSMSWFSADGETWSEPVLVGQRDNWLWRVTWHEGQAYGVGYSTNHAKDRLARLFRSPDGKKFEVLVEELFDQGYPNETSLVFTEDKTCHCLLRRDADSRTGMFGTSQPPYTDWSWQDLGIHVGGPQMIQLPDGRLLAAVRLVDGHTRTSLCWIEPEGAKITEFLELPSGGDTSYAGMVWHADRLWVSYYSGHEANDNFTTAIYLAEVELD